MAGKYPFLADEWFEAIQGIIGASPVGAGPNMMVNLVVTGTPFETDREFHMGSWDGAPTFAAGHSESADVTLTTDYATAKELFVSGNPQAAMQAFMSGKVRVQGDMAKLMMGGPAGGAPGADPELQAAIRDITLTD